jgi:hypothetical protein
MERRSRALPRETCSPAERLATPRGGAKGGQESAEAEVAANAPRRRARREEPNRTRPSMREGDVESRAGMPERARKAGGGTAGGTGTERQARTAGREEAFLWERLRLRVNRTKSAVARPWRRMFPGYSVTAKHKPRLKMAPESVKRLKAKLRPKLRAGRGRDLARTIRELTPVTRGWVAYYRLAEVKQSFEILDEWLRRRLRCIVWRQWKRPRTRLRKLREYGLEQARAAISAYNGRGAWWNAGSSHMHQALPTAALTRMGLTSLLEEHRRLACSP